jgi:hypothetical protein
MTSPEMKQRQGAKDRDESAKVEQGQMPKEFMRPGQRQYAAQENAERQRPEHPKRQSGDEDSVDIDFLQHRSAVSRIGMHRPKLAFGGIGQA